MSTRIRKAAVLGAGVMGSGIAAHLANAGIPALLLDIVPPKAAPGEDTDVQGLPQQVRAGGAGQHAQAEARAPSYSEQGSSLIEVGNFDDDLERIAECDWVIEVVKEDLAVKQALFAQVEPHARARTRSSAPTPRACPSRACSQGRGADFRKRFLVTHFFNPVRYMKLLELVAGQGDRPGGAASASHDFGEEVLGKGIVYGKDTTNFIANRIGVYGMMRTIAEMHEGGAAPSRRWTRSSARRWAGPSRPCSAPRTSSAWTPSSTWRRTATTRCPATRSARRSRSPTSSSRWWRRGCSATRPAAASTRRTRAAGGEKEILALDLKTLEYRPQKKVRFESLGAAKDVEDVRERVAAVLNGQRQGRQVRRAGDAGRAGLRQRAASREIADDLVNIDRGVRWGFAWDLGPFETWDAIGVKKGLERMKELGLKPAAVGGGDARRGPRALLRRRRAATPTGTSRSKVGEAGAGEPARRCAWSTCGAATRRSTATTAPRSGTWATASRCSSSTRR